MRYWIRGVALQSRAVGKKKVKSEAEMRCEAFFAKKSDLIQQSVSNAASSRNCHKAAVPPIGENGVRKKCGSLQMILLWPR